MWERFANTLLELYGSTGPITVDLRRPLGVSTRERLPAFPRPLVGWCLKRTLRRGLIS
jgi:hypothetical protein